MNIKNVFIVGSLATMLAATGCSGQAAARNNNPARNLTNSANSAFNRSHNNNTYGYGYDNFDDYSANGYYVNDYANKHSLRNHSNNTNNNYGRAYDSNYNGITGYSYDNTWLPSTAGSTNMAL